VAVDSERLGAGPGVRAVSHPVFALPKRARYVDAESNAGMVICVSGAVLAGPLGWVGPLVAALGVLIVAHANERWWLWYRAANRAVREATPASPKGGPNSPPALPSQERELIELMFRCFDALRRAGWMDAMYAPRDGSELEVIEAGSTGIHKATRDGMGAFWVADEFDLWPSRPVLFRAKAKST